MQEYTSDMMALMHYLKKPVTLIENRLVFVKCEFHSVKEAKRRALLIALLSYNLMKRTFVKFFDEQMIQNPLLLMHLRKLWSAYNTHDWQAEELKKRPKIINEEAIINYKHTCLILAPEDHHLATSDPYIKSRVKSHTDTISEPDEVIQVAKDIIITSTKEEINQLEIEAIQKQLEDDAEKKQHQIQERIKK